jgi:hypothetical protein
LLQQISNSINNIVGGSGGGVDVVSLSKRQKCRCEECARIIKS